MELEFVFGGPDGIVDMTACADNFEGDKAETIPWETLDFENDVDAVQWGDYYKNANANANANAMTWIDLIGDNPTFLDADADIEGLVSSGVCTLLSQAANLSEELGCGGLVQVRIRRDHGRPGTLLWVCRLLRKPR